MINLICPRCGGDVTTVQRREKTRGPVPCLFELLGVVAVLLSLAAVPWPGGLVIGGLIGGPLLVLGHCSSYQMTRQHTCSQCGAKLAGG